MIRVILWEIFWCSALFSLIRQCFLEQDPASKTRLLFMIGTISCLHVAMPILIIVVTELQELKYKKQWRKALKESRESHDQTTK